MVVSTATAEDGLREPRRVSDADDQLHERGGAATSTLVALQAFEVKDCQRAGVSKCQESRPNELVGSNEGSTPNEVVGLNQPSSASSTQRTRWVGPADFSRPSLPSSIEEQDGGTY